MKNISPGFVDVMQWKRAATAPERGALYSSGVVCAFAQQDNIQEGSPELSSTSLAQNIQLPRQKSSRL
ncbi:uncharacterized [Tachysurus ichikawai]